MNRGLPHAISGFGCCVASVLTVAACGGGEDSAATTSAADGEGLEATVDDRFPVGPDDHRLALLCYGEGSPTIVLEAGFGQGGTAQFFDPTTTEALAKENTVCTYDRAGEGLSEPIPKKRRTIDDLTGDLHDLLAAGEVPPPYVMAGASFGGFVSTYYASVYPAEVSGLVLLDVPEPDPRLARKEPSIQWDSPENLTRVDAVEVETRLSEPLAIGGIPVTVVTGSGSTSNAYAAKFWGGLTDDAEVIRLNAGHEVYAEAPEAVRDAIVANVARSR